MNSCLVMDLNIFLYSSYIRLFICVRNLIDYIHISGMCTILGKSLARNQKWL